MTTCFENKHIPFTQFLRPDGKRRSVYTEDVLYTDEVLKKADDILDAGLTFCIEEMMTGDITMYITDDEFEQDAVIAVCSNGKDVPINVAKMISEFNIDDYMSNREKTDG